MYAFPSSGGDNKGNKCDVIRGIHIDIYCVLYIDMSTVLNSPRGVAVT